MSKVSDITAGFVETLEAISHDPEDYDTYDLLEYIETIPDPAKVLKEFALYVHSEYL